ncbi:MAG: phosphate butyryltransferase [Prevotella sp.]|nr:phosphate butyryltransferase [Prevotella sp.]MDY4038945.1 phosphate acyltransferase [Prevotella sp.]
METFIRDFNDLMTDLTNQSRRRRVAVVCPDDERTKEAVLQALEMKAIDALLVCCHPLDPMFDSHRDHVTVFEAADLPTAAALGVRLVREGKAEILMKGLIGSDVILRAILNKETGILSSGKVLTHLAVASIPHFPRLLYYTDAAVLPRPTQEQRVAQVAYMADFCHRMGISRPKISLIHCSEKTDAKNFPFVLGYQEIKDMAQRGDFGPCIVDGPLDLKTSCSRESMDVKGIQSPIAGEADALVIPEIESANIFHKAITLFTGADIACLLQGTEAPVVLPSRSDSARTKLLSLALACRMLSAADA